MIKIEYIINGVAKETHYQLNTGLANALIKRLKSTTHKLGEFKITKV